VRGTASSLFGAQAASNAPTPINASPNKEGAGTVSWPTILRRLFILAMAGCIFATYVRNRNKTESAHGPRRPARARPVLPADPVADPLSRSAAPGGPSPRAEASAIATSALHTVVGLRAVRALANIQEAMPVFLALALLNLIATPAASLAVTVRGSS